MKCYKNKTFKKVIRGFLFFDWFTKKMNNKKTMESLLLSGFCFKPEYFMNMKEGNNLIHDKNGI